MYIYLKMSNKNTDAKLTREEVFGRDPRGWAVALNALGLLVIVAATMIPLLRNGFDYMWYRYLYAAGAAMVLVAKLFTPYTGKVLRMKRLQRLEAWSGIFFAVAAFFMFYTPGANRDWLAFTLAGGAVQVVATVMMTRLAKKLLK